MRIDDGCWCSSLFMLLKSQDGGRLCVGESVKSLSFSQSDFLRKESLFAVPSSPLCIMTCFLWTLTACLHLLSLLGHLNARRPVLCPQGPAGPSLYNVCPGGPKLSLTICLHLGCSLLPGQTLPHFSTFYDKLNRLSLEESSLAAPSHPQGERDLPQSVSPTAVSRLQVRSFREVTVLCHHVAHVCLFR